MVNRQWRKVSQQAHLYAHHLAHCPSYAAAHKGLSISPDEADLPRLRRLFAREIKRNLMDVYLRPRQTTINLVSNSISMSSAPGGEAFQFSISPTGHYVLAYSSSRIYIIDVTGDTVEVTRELKILRRPASVALTDDGSTLAVLSTDLQIDVYNMTSEPPKHIRVLTLDHSPRTIALSPTGAVLAAAYDSGIEVSSLEDEHAVIGRRAVKCYGVDALSFSKDGRQLLGTTFQSRSPSTVVLAAPYYDPASQPPEESVSALWTTSILFPNGSRDCSHSVLLPSPFEEESTWAFTYDRIFETFRAVRVDDLRNGTTYFTGPLSTTDFKLVPSTLPAASRCGELVAAGFQGSIWLYGLPEDLEAVPNLNNGAANAVESDPGTPISHRSLNRRNSAPSLHSVHRREPSFNRIPQWQILCDKYRNSFIEGKNVATFEGVTAMTWVDDRCLHGSGQRLVLVSPGITQPPESEADGMDPIDGGRLCLLDFNYNAANGIHSSVTIEVGLNEPEVLEEEHRDLAEEVAIVRRRTVAQRRSMHGEMMRSVVAKTPRPTTMADPSTTAPPITPNVHISSTPLPNDLVETISIEEEQYAIDDPYSHTDPRSAPTLRRAATAAARSRRFVASEYVQIRRADGREEHPHESDAENWSPPPPPYTRDPLPPLPEHIQRSIIAENAALAVPRPATTSAQLSEVSGLDASARRRPRTTSWSPSLDPARETHTSSRRSVSESTAMARDTSPFERDMPRRASPVSGFDELYDVSPPGTPRPGSRMLEVPGTTVLSSARNVSPHSTSSEDAPQVVARQPLAPIPRPADEISRPQVLDWNPDALEDETPPSPVSISSTAHNTMEHLDEELPPCLVDSHRMTSPPSPIMETSSGPYESALPAELPSQHGLHPSVSTVSTSTAPIPVAVVGSGYPVELQAANAFREAWPRVSGSAHSHESDLSHPSEEQLARLNSRSGRPSSRLFTDPARRQSATLLTNEPFTMAEMDSYSNTLRATQDHRSMPYVPTAGTNYPSTAPIPASTVAFAYAENTAQMPQVSYNSHSSGLGPTAYASSSPRPSMPRLDTIQSVRTNPEPLPAFSPNHHPSHSPGIGRSSSRARKHVEKPIAEKAKTSWRRSMTVRLTRGRSQRYHENPLPAVEAWTAPETPVPVPAPAHEAWKASDAVEMEGEGMESKPSRRRSYFPPRAQPQSPHYQEGGPNTTAKSEKQTAKGKSRKRGDGKCTVM